MSRLDRLINVFRPSKVHAEIDEELRFHIDARIADNTAAGMSAEEARSDALRRFGGAAAALEKSRDANMFVWLETALQDLRYAVRGFRKNPAFTATAVLSLALGIGANTAIFGLIDALMLRWLPVRDPQELLQLKLVQARQRKGSEASLSYTIVKALAAQEGIFAGAGGFSGWTFNVGTPGSLARVQGEVVTGGYYQTLGLKPEAGRLISDADDQPGAAPVAVLSYGYWERHFQRNPGAVGTTVLLNGLPVNIIGVSPTGFVGADVGRIADITMPVAAVPSVSPESGALLGPGNFWLRALARPKAGVTANEIRARLAVVWPGMTEQVISPDWPPARRKAMASARFELVPGGTGYTNLRDLFRQPLTVLMVVVALVLLIACANVANLLLARAMARQRELATRLAIGAGRARLIRQLLTESILLSALGAAAGIAMAWPASYLLLDILSTGPQRQLAFDLTPNWDVLGFTSAVAIATGILFGIVPALQTFQKGASGPSLALKGNSRLGRSRLRLLSALASAQVALSILLLIAAGLFVRTLQNLENLNPGFQREGVLLVDLEGQRTALPKELLDELRQVPGVVAVSLSTHTPLSGSTWTEPAVPRGQPVPDGDNAVFVGAGPGFFETMQIPLAAGREFAERDSAKTTSVALINETYARVHFPGANPVGQHLSAMVRGERRDLEIVGIAKDVMSASLRQQSPPTVYVPYYQLPVPNPGAKFTAGFPTTIEIRGRGSLARVASAVQARLQTRLPDRPVEVGALSTQVEARLVQERLLAALAGGFGALALVLACTGLYGLLAYSVTRRTREIGIRLALGAQRRSVTGMVVRNAFGLVLAGIALGVPAALASSRWIKSMLFGLAPTDPKTILGAALLLIGAALAASYFPARRAANVDPMNALRHE
jgi:predicted permease